MLKLSRANFCLSCAGGAETHAGPNVFTCSCVDHRNTTNGPSPRTHGTCCWTLETWSQTTCRTTMKKVSFPLSDFQRAAAMEKAGAEDGLTQSDGESGCRRWTDGFHWFSPMIFVGSSSGAWPVLIDDFVEFARPIVTGLKRKTL